MADLADEVKKFDLRPIARTITGAADKYIGPAVDAVGRAFSPPAPDITPKAAPGTSAANREIWEAKGVPGRAKGGPVKKGKEYIVGEKGPEKFVPKQSGKIVPNSKLPNAREFSANPTQKRVKPKKKKKGVEPVPSSGLPQMPVTVAPPAPPTPRPAPVAQPRVSPAAAPAMPMMPKAPRPMGLVAPPPAPTSMPMPAQQKAKRPPIFGLGLGKKK